MPLALISLAVCISAIQAGDDAAPTPSKQAYEALRKEYEAADAAYMAERISVGPADPRWVERYKTMPFLTFGPRFVQFAEAHRRDPEAVDALIQVLDFLGGAYARDKAFYVAANRGVALLIEDHLEEERVVQACLLKTFRGFDFLEPYFRALLERSGDRETRARACLALVYCLERWARDVERPYFDHPEDSPAFLPVSDFLDERLDPLYIRRVRAANRPAVIAESETLLRRIIDEFGDIPFLPDWAPPPPPGRAKSVPIIATLADYARPHLEARRLLAIGQPAPEILGEEIDGKPLRLSDYRGKVVLLVFWGTWCGPCMAKVPNEKALAERLKDRPFAILGINSDADRDALKAAVVTKGITWPSWFDGGRTGGPIATRWDIHGWPTTIVLDKSGIIRFRNPDSHGWKGLEDAVDLLLEEKAP